MKALEEINAKELKAVVKELNESGVLPKKIRLVGISIENLIKEFSKAIEELPEDAKVPQMAADFYNDLYADEIDEDDGCDIEESEDDSEDDESDEDESDEDEDDSEGEEDDEDCTYSDEEDESGDEEDDDDDSDEDDVDDESEDDDSDDEDEPEEEPEPEPVKPEKKESKKKEKPTKEEKVKPEKKEKPTKEEKVKPEKKEKAPKEPKPKKEAKPKEEVPINTKVAKEQQAKVKKVWNNLTKKSTLFDLDLAVVKGLLANPKISPKDLCEAVAKDMGEDFEKVKREATKIISAFHYLIENYPVSKEKSKMNRAVQMVMEGENPKFIHSSTVIVIKRMLTAYGATIGLKFKEA